MKFPPTAPAWWRRWMSAPPRSSASSAGPSRARCKVLGSALARKRRAQGRHRHQPGTGRGIHPRLRRRGREPCRCPHPECADLGQLRPAGLGHRRAVMALDGALVSDAHLRALLADGRASCRLEGHEIIQSAPTSYVVDEARGRARSDAACSASASASPCMRWRSSRRRCRISSWRWSAAISMWWARCSRAYASGLATLTEDEKQIGATVIDMGGGVHLHRRLPGRPSGPCRCGADGRLCRHRRHRAHAGRAAFRRRAHQDAVSARRWATWKPAPMSSRCRRWARRATTRALRVPRSMLTRIIQARLEEIFGEVQKRLQASRLRRGGRPPRGADRRRLPAGRHPRTGGAHPEQAGAHRPAAELSRAWRRRRPVRTMPPRSAF